MSHDYPGLYSTHPDLPAVSYERWIDQWRHNRNWTEEEAKRIFVQMHESGILVDVTVVVTESWMFSLVRKKQMLGSKRGRRFLICDSADQLRDAVAHIGGTQPAVLNEAINLAIVAQRLALALNDGHLSASRLQSF